MFGGKKFKVSAYNNHNGELVTVFGEYANAEDAEKEKVEKEPLFCASGDYRIEIEET